MLHAPPPSSCSALTPGTPFACTGLGSCSHRCLCRLLLPLYLLECASRVVTAPARLYSTALSGNSAHNAGNEEQELYPFTRRVMVKCVRIRMRTADEHHGHVQASRV